MFGVVLEGGTLTSSAAGCCRLLVRLVPSGAGGERGRGECGVVGTLLGPEGADPMSGADGNVRAPVGVGSSCRGRPGFSYHSSGCLVPVGAG